MTKQFNKGDIVRVVNNKVTYDGTSKLEGMLFEMLYDCDSRLPAIDVTAVSKRVKGFEGWQYDKSTRGWYVDAENLELVQSSAPKKAVKRTTKVEKKALSPQCQQLLSLLEAKGSVTALEAGGVYRIRALPRRIADLKEAGYTIVRDLNTDTTGQRYARYYLKGTVPQAVAA